MVDQKSKVECLLFAIVVRNQVDWLAVFGEIAEEHRPDQISLMLVPTLQNELFRVGMQHEVRLDDSSFGKGRQIEFFVENEHEEGNFLRGTKPNKIVLGL